MSLRKIANALGVSHAFLSQIRNGKRPMPEELKDRLEGINAYHLVMNGKQTEESQNSRTPVLLERETGFEPATACLEGRNSTAELLPRDSRIGSRAVAVKAGARMPPARRYAGGVVAAVAPAFHQIPR